MKLVPLLLTAALTAALPISIPAIDFVSGGGSRNPAANANINRGIIKYIQGDPAAARSHFDQAIRLDPKAWAAYYDRASLSFEQRQWNLALRDINESMRFYRKYLHAAVLRAAINEQLGRHDEALKELDHLFSIHLSAKTAEEVYNQRGWIRATCRDPAFRNGRLAIADGIHACNLSHWKSSNCLDTLAAAYAESGDFDSAVRTEQKAIEAISNSKESKSYLDEYRKLFGRRLTAFQQHKIPSYE